MTAPLPLPYQRAGIAPDERAHRQASIDFSRGSVRLEGFSLSAEAEAINRRYVDGDITLDEHIAAIGALGEA